MVNISGNNASLRTLVFEDHSVLFNWKNDPDLNALILAPPLAFTPEMAKDWIQRNTNDKNQVLFGIQSNANAEKLIGVIRLMFIDWINRNAELGIFIGEKGHVGKGIGTEVILMILNYAFTDLNLNRIFLRVAKDHLHAVSLYEKIGFNHEGTLRQQVWRKGEYIDVLFMGILRTEFLK